MCSPAVVPIMMALSTAVQVKSSVDQGNADKAVANYNAAVDENTATEVKNKAIIVESEERQKAAEFRGKQRATLAARGVNVDEGSALQVQEDTTLLGEINAMRVRENASSQVSALTTSADIGRFQGRTAARQGALGAIGAGVGGAGRVADKWYAIS